MHDAQNDDFALLFRIGNNEGRPDMTSSLVPATRPGRPMPG